MLLKIPWTGLSCHTCTCLFHLILIFLCSAQSPIAKIPSCQSQLGQATRHLSHTATSYTQLGLTQDFPSECGKLTAAGRWGWQWWGTERTGRCAAPAKSQGKPLLPDRQQTLHKSTLLCPRTANPRGSHHNPASTAASCLMTIKALKQEEMGWGLRRAKRRPTKCRSSHLSPSQHQTSLESLCCRHTMPDKSSTLRHRRESFSSALTTGIHPHAHWMVGSALKKKWWMIRDKQSLPSWGLQSTL